MSSLSNKTWTCPYYSGSERRRRDGRPTIHCEGGSRVVCPDRAAFDRHADFYCCGTWRACSIAQGRNDFYEREEMPADERRKP